MPQRLDAAFVFGSLGNLTEALGEGWSVEDNFAWAVDAESRLNLPLPRHAARLSLRFTVHPLVQPGVLDAQRLSIETPAGPLASFSIDNPTTIELDLPIELTRDRSCIELILRHPDAIRPRDIGDSEDERLLSICFMSAALSRQLDEAVRPQAEAAPLRHLLVAGGDLAQHIARVMTALPILRGRVACHFIDTEQERGNTPPAREALQLATLCWEQSGDRAAASGSRLSGVLQSDCVIRRFAAPRIGALWPFLCIDPRLTFEAELYPGGRYPFGDRVGVSLASLQLSDDIMLLSYESMTEKDMPDLDAMLSADAAAWRWLDSTHDVQVADFIMERFRSVRLFFAPSYPTGILLRHVIGQLLADSPIEALCDPAMLRRELDFLLTGYLGRREELPIHPQVARRLGLAWWHPGMRYRWHSNHWTFEQFMLRYIRWTPWRP